MSLNLTNDNLDNSIDEWQLQLEYSDYSDPYIEEIILEKQDLVSLEDIGFQDYIGLLQE